MRWLALVPAALFAAIAGFLLSGLYRADPDGLPSTFIGRAAPALTVTELDGRTLLTPALLAADDVKLVNFFASWCVPCRVEHPQIEALGKLLPVYGIDHKDKPEDAARFLQELGDPYAAIGADPGRTGIDWGITGVPETFVIDADGRVAFRYAGPITASVMTDTILPAIDAARVR